ncbi:MAG: hypothetical protein ACLVHS_03080 [Blautia wexlerae]
MSKEKTYKNIRRNRSDAGTGVPAQETEEVSTALATEIIADLKKQLEEAKEEAKEWEESWNMCREQVRALSRQSDIISIVLRMDNVELLDLAFGFVERML